MDLEWKKRDNIEIKTNFHRVVRSSEIWNGFEVFRLVWNKSLVFEFIGKNENEIKCLRFLDGVFYWRDRVLGFYWNGVHLQGKVEDALNVCESLGFVAVLRPSGVYKFLFKARNKAVKGSFRLRLQEECLIKNLSQWVSVHSLKKSFIYGVVTNTHLIASDSSVFIIRSQEIVQKIETNATILTLTPTHLLSINKEFYLKVKSEKSDEKGQEFKPEKRALLALAQFYQINEVGDLFFFKDLGINIEKKMTNDWHLDPLDRSYLASNQFYQEQLYDYIDKYLNLTVQGLFLTNPDKLLMLQEALREQENRIYRDGHLMPDKTIASLITNSLPLPSSCDTVLQNNIRSLFLNSLKKN